MLTTGRIAAFCQVDARTVNRWIDRGALKAHPLPLTKLRRVRVEDFVKFLEGHQMPIPGALRTLGRNRILVADDDRALGHMLKAVLLEASDQGDYEVAVAPDGFEAGMMVHKFKPDVLILDLRMPRVDGFEVCRRLKADPETKHIRIVAISGVAEEEDIQRIKELGADEFMAKPLKWQELKARVDRLLKNMSKRTGR